MGSSNALLGDGSIACLVCECHGNALIFACLDVASAEIAKRIQLNMGRKKNNKKRTDGYDDQSSSHRAAQQLSRAWLGSELSRASFEGIGM